MIEKVSDGQSSFFTNQLRFKYDTLDSVDSIDSTVLEGFLLTESPNQIYNPDNTFTRDSIAF
ncbi:MAG TPA: hypothetical protein PK390_07540, partial [Fervidobacterium nodosum]|nr:hypothetical protein [Fervidobacterium nodosum]